MTPYPHGFLVQESLPSEWHILVSAILLNQSRRTLRWDDTLHQIFGRWNTPQEMSDASEDLEVLLKPHGFQNVKAKRLRRMSEDYLTWDRKSAKDLYGCGQYAHDSWRIFVLGDRPEAVDDGPLQEFLDSDRAKFSG